jgi:hypothetical protein
MAEAVQKARCVNCRSDIVVPASYQHGDHVKCGSCGMRHKVSRGDVLRLVLAAVGPLRDALQANQGLQRRLESDLSAARGSFGVGVNGLGLGVLYAIAQIVYKDRLISADLGWEAAGVAVLSGLALEAANFLFLAKRQKIRRLSDEIQEARAEGRALQQKIREAGKV